MPEIRPFVRHQGTESKPNGSQRALLVLLGVAWALGGGGVGAALPNLVVQLTALVLLWLHLPLMIAFWRNAPLGLKVLVGLSLALPIVQILPIPPAAWHVMPGRGIIIESLRLIGEPDSWRPWSINGQRTLLAAAGLVAPLAALVFAWRTPGRDARPIMMLVVGLGLVAVILGAFQLATGNEAFLVHEAGSGSNDLQGTFANRNTSGLFLVIALACLVSLPATGWRFADRGELRLAAGAVLVIGIVTAHSRSAMLLALIPIALAAWRFAATRGAALRSRGAVAIVVILIVATTAALVASGGNRFTQAADRFAQTDDARAYIWPDALVVTQRFWPAGGGMGTFDDAFQLDESLETLQPLRAGRAHNDYLEIAYEAGIAGVLLVLAWVIWLVATSARLFKRRAGGAGAAAPLVLWLIALQSIVDYPLRNQALLCIAACMIGLAAGTVGVAGRQGRKRNAGAAGADDFRRIEGRGTGPEQ